MTKGDIMVDVGGGDKKLEWRLVSALLIFVKSNKKTEANKICTEFEK